MTLPLTELGRTGLRVSRVGLGLAALGRPGYINLGRDEDLGAERTVDELARQTEAVLDAARSAGVRYFDVARSYGRGEAFLGGWLEGRGVRPEEVVVGSKWGYTYTAGWRVEAERHEVKEHSVAVLRRQREESREQLGTHLDLYQIHSATRESGVLGNGPVLNELARLRAEEGLRIGLTLSGPDQAATLREALEVRVEGERLFDCVQATWNLLERSAGPALADAHGEGLGVIVKEAVANGRLGPHNRDPDFAAARAVLEREAERLGTTLDALALAAVLAEPWCHVVLSGAATAGQLAANLAAVGVRWDGEAAAALSVLREEPARYWATRGELAWN